MLLELKNFREMQILLDELCKKEEIHVGIDMTEKSCSCYRMTRYKDSALHSFAIEEKTVKLYLYRGFTYSLKQLHLQHHHCRMGHVSLESLVAG